MRLSVRSLARVLAWALALFALLVAGLILWVTVAFPKVRPAEPLAITPTAALLERGEYLFNAGAACAACHSERDWTRYYGPVKTDSIGQGGERFGAAEGIPGAIYASNVTSSHLAGWTDGEIRRALVAGVSRDGRPLFPLMPWPHYAKLGEDDLAALIVYMRTLPPKATTMPEARLSFPMNLIVRTMPQDATPPAKAPAPTDPAYPTYVTNAAACLHCHSPASHGTPIPGLEFSGGVPFAVPGFGTVHSSNITPHHATGIGGWTKDVFIARFRAAEQLSHQATPPKAFNSPMPWASYAGMTDWDLGAIYDFLRTLPAVERQVPAPVPTP